MVAGHLNDVTSLAHSPDGKHIVSGSNDTTVKIWDAQTGEEVSRRVLTTLSSDHDDWLPGE
jgi:WD40 repeat protein